MSRSRCWVVVRLSLVMFVLSAGLSACKSTTPRKHWWEFWKPKAPATSSLYTDDTALAPAPSGPGAPGSSESAGMGEATLPPEARPTKEAKGMIAALKTVYFAYDSAEINPSEQQVLSENAEWLKANADVVVQIEGHCDERGTPEYNLNLGQRRANAVKQFLVEHGVAPERLMTISYGEERPVDLGKTEQAYQLNRRAQFLVYE